MIWAAGAATLSLYTPQVAMHVGLLWLREKELEYGNTSYA